MTMEQDTRKVWIRLEWHRDNRLLGATKEKRGYGFWGRGQGVKVKIFLSGVSD